MLHENTRRRVCRAAFVAVCVVPTLLVLGWLVARRLPGQAEAAATALGKQLGLSASVADVSYPRPGAVLHRTVELRDTETGAVVLSARVVETWAGGPSCVLSASQVEVHATTLEQLWRVVDRMLREAAPGSPSQVRFVAGDVTWHGPTHKQTFTGLEGRIGPAGNGDADQEMTLRFRLAGSAATEPITVRVVRRRGSQPPLTSVMVQTGGTPLPLVVFAPWLDGQRFGSRATYRGYAAIDLRPTGWEGELSGELSDVDLATLTAGQLPHIVSGTATLTLDRAKLVEGRLVDAAGSLVAGPGTIGRSLVLSAGEALALFIDAPPTLERVERYEQLACGFVLNERGLTVSGRCEGAERGAILVGSGSQATHPVWWRESSAGPSSCTALLRAIVPSSDVQAPVTRETQWLIRHLPLAPSPSTEPAAELSRQPNVQLRLVPPRSTR